MPRTLASNEEQMLPIMFLSEYRLSTATCRDALVTKGSAFGREVWLECANYLIHWHGSSMQRARLYDTCQTWALASRIQAAVAVKL